MDNSEELYLTDLISVDILQRLQDAFSTMTGMAALTTDKYGMPVTEGSNFSDFCMKYTRETPLGNSRCMRCDKSGAELSMKSKRACYYYCHAGLVDYAAPIMANGKMIGSFIGGQVLTSKPNMDAMEKTAIELGIDPEEFKEAASRIRIVNDSDVQNAANFLHVVADCLSYLAYQGYELQKSNREIEKASHLKSDFLANMSHEIRTPMNAILGMIELTLREEMSSAARECMYQIRSSAKNLLVIINDILDFSKIESGKMDIIDVVYEPLSAINDLSSIANSKIGNKDIEFTMNIQPDMTKTLFGDNVRIHKILINLITNAVKFTQQGEVHFEIISVPDEKDDDKVILKVKVSDTGIGIKENDLKKLFNSFQQVDSKRNRNIEGTGLGLVICKQLLELMGGSITVSSEYGKGSVFSFELPQKIVDKTPCITKPENAIRAGILISNIYVKNQLIKDLERIGAEIIILSDVQNIDDVKCDYMIISNDFFTQGIREYLKNNEDVNGILIDDFGDPSELSSPNIKIIHKPVYSLNLYNAMGLSSYDLMGDSGEHDTFTFIAPNADILIVDDNNINLKVAKGLIEPLKMNVETADSAAKAIEMVSQKQYDIVFMDHMMPEVDGVEATHIIRRMIPSYKDTPIIALTANAVSGAKEMFINEGMSDFVAKPIELKNMVSSIRKWLPQEKICPVDENEKSTREKESVPEIKELNVKEAVKMLGSEKLYMTVLKEYYSNIQDKIRIIDNHFSSENWREYTIEVHSLKSTSRQIGAEYVGELAAELEKAGNEGNISLIKEKNAHLISEYEKYIEILKPVFGESEEEKEDSDNLYTLLEKIEKAVADYDILEIEEVLSEIEKCGFADDQRTEFDELTRCIEKADLDGSNNVIENWKKKLELSNDDDTSVDSDKVAQMLNNLKEALNNFDILGIDNAADILKKHKYPQPQNEILQRILQYVSESDIEKCEQAADEWLSLISK